MVILGGLTVPDSLPANDTLQVMLRTAELTVSEAELSIGDVCEVRGGSVELRRKIASLDLDVVVPGTTTVISKQQVSVRIALAGISRSAIMFLGPDSVNVNLIPNEKLQQRIESKFAAELSSQFGIPKGNVRIRLRNMELLDGLRDSIDTTDFSVMAFFPTQLPLGDKHIQIEFSDSRGNRISQKVHVQIVVLHDVYVTSGVVSKGTVITAGHVQSIKRPLIDNSVELASSECLGCTASRDIPPHEIVTTRHLSRQPIKKQILVKRNDLVDIVLTKGPLRLRVKNAKVMTNGAQGEMVRVLNTNSNKEINAVVLDRTTVVVQN